MLAEARSGIGVRPTKAERRGRLFRGNDADPSRQCISNPQRSDAEGGTHGYLRNCPTLSDVALELFNLQPLTPAAKRRISAEIELVCRAIRAAKGLEENWD